MKSLWFLMCLIGCAGISILSANSINLLNDTEYTLKALIYDANGTLMGEFILNPRDANEWSDNDQNFGTENAYAVQTPYTVNWFCMGGAAYGSCSNVAAGSLVTAQGCGGVQECGQLSQAPVPAESSSSKEKIEVK